MNWNMDAVKLETAWKYLVQLAVHQGMNCLVAVLILIAGWWLSACAAESAQRALDRTHLDETVRPMLANAFQWIVRVLTIVLVLSQFGVQTASIIAMLGAAGLAIGLALQGTLQNIAAGLMLVLLRPFRIGQYIDAQGVAGTVREVSLFMTELTTADGVRLRVPNGKLWGSAITNYSENASRRIDIETTVAFGGDMHKGLDALHKMLSAEPRLLPEPKPEAMVVNYTEQGVTLNLRCWTSSDDYWTVRYAFYERIKKVLEEAGCKLVSPIQEVRMPDPGATPVTTPPTATPEPRANPLRRAG